MRARRHGPRTRLGWTMRFRLRRRIFWWFGASIVLTAIVVRATVHAFGPGHRAGLALGVAALVLWAISGRIARRLARPFDQLAAIAGELGRGRLSARIALDRCDDEDVALVGGVMNDLATRVEKQLHDQRELLAAVSHEIRTPLARVRLLTELARDGGDVVQRLDAIDAEVQEIDALVGELLASARLDFAVAHPIDVDAVDAARRALDRAGLDEGLLSAEGAPSVHVDPTLLARALSNLLDNAQRHGEGVERLTVSAVDDRVRFAVLDRGPGLGPGDEERIFAAFARGARGKDDAQRPSLGLGLSLVRRIAEAHGGRARAENRLGGGALVAIELPRV